MSPCPPHPHRATRTTLRPTLAQLSAAAAGRDWGFPGKMGVGGVPTCPPPQKKRTPRPTGGRPEPRGGPAIRLLRYELLDIRRRLCSLLNMHEPGLRGWGAAAASQKGGGGLLLWDAGAMPGGNGAGSRWDLASPSPFVAPAWGWGWGGPKATSGSIWGGNGAGMGCGDPRVGGGCGGFPAMSPKCAPPKKCPPAAPFGVGFGLNELFVPAPRWMGTLQRGNKVGRNLGGHYGVSPSPGCVMLPPQR